MTLPPSSPSVVVEIRPYRLGAIALRQWRWAILFPAAVILFTVGFVLVVKPRYTATALVLPEARSDQGLPAGLAGVAAQFGLSVGKGATQSPQLYVDLLKSRTVLDTLLFRSLPGAHGAPGPRLIDWLGEGGRNAADSLYLARKFLGQRIGSELTRETGVVKLEVTLRDPQVAATVAGWVLDEINRFNAYRLQTTARNRREFVEGRIKELKGELGQAEGDLRRFLESNRAFESSPALRFEERRLEARVTLLNEVLTSLRRDFESARIDEVNDTPALTVIDAPKAPERRSFPRRTLFVVVAASASVIVGFLSALVAHTMTQLPDTDPAGRRELRAAWDELASRWRRWPAGPA